MAFDNQHKQPGRRFAKGATKDDILLGAFGLFSHIMLFLFLGALTVFLWPASTTAFLWATGVMALACLVVRGKQVGSSTTRESIAAIKRAFNE